MSNDTLYSNALDAIKAFFNDRSVTPATTLDKLDELTGEIDLLIEALENDMDGAENEDDE